jgi:glutaredoxin
MKWKVFGRTECKDCRDVLDACIAYNLDYTFYDLSLSENSDMLYELMPSAKDIPKIFLNDELIGGFLEFRHYMWYGEKK